MDKCREEFEKAFPIPAHWIEFDEKANRYYCPYVADATASTYQSKWIVWQHQQAKVEELQNEFNDFKLRAHHISVQKLDADAFYEYEKKRADELQKRVDAVEKLIQKWNGGGYDIFDVFKELEQALKGEGATNLNIDEKGECRHFSTTMFYEGKAECFHCDAVVNEEREVIGKQSKGFSWTGKEHEK